MFRKLMDYMKTNLSEVGRMDSPITPSFEAAWSMVADGNAPKVNRCKGFPFSPDDKLSQHSQKDFEQMQYDAANAPLPNASYEVNRGSW